MTHPSPTQKLVQSLDPLLNAREVAQLLSVRPKRVYELDIPFVRLSERSIRWRRSDVESWIDRRVHGRLASAH